MGIVGVKRMPAVKNAPHATLDFSGSPKQITLHVSVANVTAAAHYRKIAILLTGSALASLDLRDEDVTS